MNKITRSFVKSRLKIVPVNWRPIFGQLHSVSQLLVIYCPVGSFYCFVIMSACVCVSVCVFTSSYIYIYIMEGVFVFSYELFLVFAIHGVANVYIG